MINKIIDGISKAINTEFGDNYEIYTEKVEQGLQEPCFSIVSIKPTNTLFRPNKYYRQNSFCIHYFPSSSNPKNEFQEVCERLYNCLEYIEIEETVNENNYTSKVMGTEMNAEFSDEIGHFFINYNMYVNKIEEKTLMEIYDYDTDVKER